MNAQARADALQGVGTVRRAVVDDELDGESAGLSNGEDALAAPRVDHAPWGRLLLIISVLPQSESSQASTLASRLQRGGFITLDDGVSLSSAFRFVSKLA